MILTAGLTSEPAEPLPKHFDRIITETDQDIVVMSLGSIAVLELFPRAILDRFFSAFAQFPNLLFLCKFSGEENVSRDMPNNVLISNWLPQNDLLGHPRVKLFICHGGNNGQHEAVYHGVPIITLPIFGDQPRNAYRTELHEIGIQLDMFTFTSQDLATAIRFYP